MKGRIPSKESSTFLSIAPAPPAEQRFALAIIAALFVAFCAFIPFIRVSFPGIHAFIPISDSIMALSNLATAGLLLVGFSRSRLRAVLCLAGGYLFTGFTAGAHLLPPSGLFAGSGPLVASPQTGAWLDIFRNAGFPFFVICCALLEQYEHTAGQLRANTRLCVTSVAASVVISVCVLFFLASAGRPPFLPPVINGDSYTTAMISASAPALLLSLIALTVLGLQIEVVPILSPILAPVQIDPTQFETALLNLALS
jgi:two-component system sensor histidine kinase UhpB